jgi:hypothetical protein
VRPLLWIVVIIAMSAQQSTELKELQPPATLML